MALSLSQLLPLLAELNADRSATVALSEVAEALDLSPWYVQRHFARVVGESPKQYRLRLRLEAAAALLRGTQDTVLDIALAVGFDSHEGFTRAFSRRFNRSPSAYRRRGDPVSADHGAVVASVGPCIHLFRAPISTAIAAETERKIMTDKATYDITRQPIDETPILYIARRTEHAGIAEALGETLPVVFGHAMSEGLEMAGPPFTRYIEWGPAMVTIHAGVPMKKASVGDTDKKIEAGALPGGEAAVTIHTGPYEQLGEAHAAIERWIEENELTSAGGPWEIYLTDPGEVPNPADWKTQIVWPLAA